MIDVNELIDAFTSVMLREMRGEIDHDRREAALRELEHKAIAAGMSDLQLASHAASGFMRAMAIADEVRFSPSGRWQ